MSPLTRRLSVVALSLYCLVCSGCLGVSTNNTVPAPPEVVAPAQWQQHTVKIPAITVYDLEGVKHSFPEEFEGKRTLLLIAFKHEQQALLDPWLRAVVPLIDSTPNFAVIEMPTIERSSAAFRAMVNNGMRSGIDDEMARRRTMTLYVNKKELLNTIGISDESTVYALLVDHTGSVIWRYDGEYSSDALAKLVSELQ